MKVNKTQMGRINIIERLSADRTYATNERNRFKEPQYQEMKNPPKIEWIFHFLVCSF